MDAEMVHVKRRHNAIAKKAKFFAMFDAGKRPADIADLSVKRTTLFQYFIEWRREKGIEGKRTGFAIHKFSWKVYSEALENAKKEYLEAREKARIADLRAKEHERRRREREIISRYVLGWEAILRALRTWDGERDHATARVYLPADRYDSSLRDQLRSQMDRRSQRPMDLTKKENIEVYGKWVQAGRKAKDRADFKRLCGLAGTSYPPEIDR